jgi:hypothetical protein
MFVILICIITGGTQKNYTKSYNQTKNLFCPHQRVKNYFPISIIIIIITTTTIIATTIIIIIIISETIMTFNPSKMMKINTFH